MAEEFHADIEGLSRDYATGMVNDIHETFTSGGSAELAESIAKQNEALVGKDSDMEPLKYDEATGEVTLMGTNLEGLEQEQIEKIINDNADLRDEIKNNTNKADYGTEKQQKSAREKEPQSKEKMEKFKEKNKMSDVDWQKYGQKLLDKLINLGIGAGLTIAALAVIAEGKSGCYIINGDDQYRVSSGDASNCYCDKISTSCNTYCTKLLGSNYKGTNCCEGSAGDKGDSPCVYSVDDDGKQIYTDDTNKIPVTTGGYSNRCNCVSADDPDMLYDLEIRHIERSWEDELTSIASTAGYYVTEVGDAGLDLVRDVTGFLGMSWFYWLLIIAAVVVVVVLMAVLIPKAVKKSKQSAGASSSVTSSSG